jgi:hypothetical protein
MLVRFTRWSLITAPVVAGVLVLILGTAGSISTLFGWFLICLAPIVWMWNWLVRMSFNEDNAEHESPVANRRDDEPTPIPKTPQRHHQDVVPHHARQRLTRPPRRRS